MERQRLQDPRNPLAGGGTPDGDSLDGVRDRLEGILHAADAVLDGIRPLNAEDFLQQNRQNGGQ